MIHKAVKPITLVMGVLAALLLVANTAHARDHGYKGQHQHNGQRHYKKSITHNRQRHSSQRHYKKKYNHSNNHYQKYTNKRIKKHNGALTSSYNGIRSGHKLQQRHHGHKNHNHKYSSKLHGKRAYWKEHRNHGYKHRRYNNYHYYYNHIGFYFPNYGHIKHGHKHNDHCPTWHFKPFAAGLILGSLFRGH